ncbi:putative glycoside hydrolase/deacetylase [metagenome]|uniref:Putative glycoside hydrolase/deacetylase n=1 Tax=metagenome TaxID=256318 RepID=A0A2P2BWH7_9ZZZZ
MRSPDLRIDLNADLGEEVTDDAGLLAVVTSANVACGYHAGSAVIMRRVCAEAARLGVRVGAQVSYDDRPNFGRVAVEISPALLAEQVADQVGTLQEIAAAEGTTVGYLKPHGALYHRVLDDPVQAAAVLAGSGSLPVLSLPGSVILSQAAEDGRGTFLEGFPDRGYTSEGRLVPRGQAGALVEDARTIAVNAVAVAGRVDSVCVHGDSPGAVENARQVRRALVAAGHTVRAFV